MNQSKLTKNLDAALAAVKESNRCLMKSILARDDNALEKGVIRLRASRCRLTAAVRGLRLATAP